MKRLVVFNASIFSLVSLLLIAPVGASSHEHGRLKSGGWGGIGSTVAEMKAIHGRSRGPGIICTAANSCYGDGLRNDESGSTFQFTGVSVADGIIVGYQQNFLRGTTKAIALAQILRWLPKDSTVGKLTIDRTGGSCGLLNITSPTLAKTLSSPKIGDSSGVIGVDLVYANANLEYVYNPKNIEDASIDIVPVNPKDSC